MACSSSVVKGKTSYLGTDILIAFSCESVSQPFVVIQFVCGHFCCFKSDSISIWRLACSPILVVHVTYLLYYARRSFSQQQLFAAACDDFGNVSGFKSNLTCRGCGGLSMGNEML